MKQTVCIFCYRGEEELIANTVDQVRAALPLASIHLFDDEADQLPGKLVNALLDMAGLHYYTTTFKRGANLNGTECIRGELACMEAACDKDKNTDGVVIKLDPDTLILRPEPIMQALAQGAEWIAHNSAKGHYAGMFYAMRRSVLDVVKRNADVIEFPEDAAEDVSIGALAYLAVHKKKHAWVNTDEPKNLLLFAAFPVNSINNEETYKKELQYVAKHGSVITVGNTVVANMPKAYRVKIMRDLLAEFRNPTTEDKEFVVKDVATPEVIE